MKKFLAMAVAVVMVVAATSAFAFGPGGCGGWGGGGMMGPGFGAVGNMNLSKEQADKMWQLKDKWYGETKDLRYQMFQKRFEMKDLYADPKADDATIRAKQKELQGLRQKMQDRMVDFRLAQRQILTPEQLKNLSDAPGWGSGAGGFRGAGFGRGRGGPGRGSCPMGAF